MELERKHLLLLFAIGIISKGFVKSAFGANVSLVLLLSVALYYWRVKRRSQTIYDDIARMQVEAAAKLDKLNGLGDGKVTEMDLHVRQTHFQLRPDDVSFITDRMHKYSRKFSGSVAERRKFLAKRKDKENVALVESDGAELPTIRELPRSSSGLTKRSAGRKNSVETAVEAAVNKTL